MIIIVGFLYFSIYNSPITQGTFNMQNTGTPLQIFQHKLRNIINNLQSLIIQNNLQYFLTEFRILRHLLKQCIIYRI